MTIGKAPAILSGILAAAVMTAGCATKKHVREAIAPVQQQVNDVQKESNANKTAIGDLDRQVASADEKATDAGKRAGQANDAASAANSAAMQAAQRADSANAAAMQAQQGVDKVGREFQNLDNYKLADTKQVYFKTGQSVLDKQFQADLDAAVDSLANMHNYVIEIEGFADHTGTRALNLELSRKRADAVVRYLTVEKNVPLRNIRMLGIGADFPNAVNKTREDRKANRRVDVKIYTLDLNASGSQASTSADNAPRPVQ